MDNNKIDNFKKEFKALLEKYNAEIYVELDGDTHCLSDALIIDIDNKEAIRFANPSSVSRFDIL
jgi:hypothetical protein